MVQVITHRNSSFLRRTYAAMFEPVDISFLVFFRVLFGGIVVWEVYRYFSNGWIARYYIEPAVKFTYYGFSWVKPSPWRGMYVHFFVLGLAAAFVMVGFLYRLAAPVFFLTFTYCFLLDQTRYLNHLYLICLIGFLMCFLPANRRFPSTRCCEREFVPTSYRHGPCGCYERNLAYHTALLAQSRGTKTARRLRRRRSARARVMVSLNGRESQLLIDPNVDLTQEDVGLLPADWVLPLTTPLTTPLAGR